MLEVGLDEPRWEEFVGSVPGAWPYHHPAWAGTLAECYGFPAWGIAIVDPDDSIAAGLPVMETRTLLGRRRRISLPFTDFCAPLTTNPVAFERLALAVRQGRLGNPHGVAEIRAPISGAGGYQQSSAVMHLLGLGPGPDTLFKGFHKSQVQRAIRKTERDGKLEIRRATSESDVSEVFYGLHLNTRRRQGVPVQPRKFFQLLWQKMLQPGIGFCLLAYEGKLPVAGAVFLEWNGVVTYKFGASEPSSWGLRPNHMIFWTAIQDACARGAHLLDFGRTDLGNEGLRGFKSSWGAREEPLVYTAFGNSPPAPGKGRAEAALAAVIRRSPPAVCRMVGAALYRYAA